MEEARAVKKNIRSSPRKMRLVIDQIRGKKINEALGILRFMPNSASRDAEKLLFSAMANLRYPYEHGDKAGYVDEEDIFVKQVFVNQGPTMKRIRPAPQGRAYRVRKRSHHLTIVVGTR